MDRRAQTITLSASSAKTGSGDSGPVGVERYTEALLFIDVTAVAGTNPTLDFDVEAGPADGELGFIHTEPAQITGAGKVLVKLSNIGPWLRLKWTLGGTNPSFTFSAKLAPKT
ncbi:MAG: hypothetical protein HYY66_00185 [Candidatus Tectomicrobia bacterium]|nr:hypothetical protein [Candidatus Tectomicrobia bacterium]